VAFGKASATQIRVAKIAVGEHTRFKPLWHWIQCSECNPFKMLIIRILHATKLLRRPYFYAVKGLTNVLSEAWKKGLSSPFLEGEFGRLQLAKIQGLTALITPSWSLDTGFQGKTWDTGNDDAVLEAMRSAGARLAVVDLPAGTGVSGGDKHHVQCRHTRIFDLVSELPSHRRKQVRRAEKLGLQVVEDAEEVSKMVELHQVARTRKSIPSDEQGLFRLLNALGSSGGALSLFVEDEQGERIAGGVFLRTGIDTMLYAFGGAFRSPQSSLASVLLLEEAMQRARQLGCTHFDFGGSQDQGVDRFYAEFGAEAVLKYRLVYCASGWKWYWRWRRPDLLR